MGQPAAGEILVIDDDPEVASVVSSVLEQEGFSVTCSHGAVNALDLIGENRFDIVITDIRMPEVDGIGILKKVKDISFETEVIIITGYGTLQNAIEALKEGASDFLLKPVDMEDIILSVQKVKKVSELRRENARYRERIEYSDSEHLAHLGTDSFMGNSADVRAVRDMIDRAAQASDSSVLITGESGTGKELAANLIHRQSSRHEGSFVSVNCSGFPASLIESELFGHVKGAFTGADRDKKGMVELADKGTLLLDEIGDMPVELQGRLLRVLEERKVRRVGGSKTIPVDFRLISATNKDLALLLEKGDFRKDLYFRLNIMHISVPPLRGREEDIEILFEHYTDMYSKKLRKTVTAVDPEVVENLKGYQFPGNVRELKNMTEQAVILCGGDALSMECFPGLCMETSIRLPGIDREDDTSSSGKEQNAILNELERNRWNIKKAAKALGIGYDALRYRMEKYDIRK